MSYKASVMGRLPFGGAHRGPGDGAAGPGEILTSGTVRDLVVGSSTVLEDRGTQPLKGVEGTWRLFSLAGL
ncbi:MAG: hypothetical protein ACJ75K_18410 [Actinomycetes bacterium]